MKKKLIIFSIIFLSFQAFSYELYNNGEYSILNKSMPHTSTIINFFSFFCPYCYEIEKQNNIRNIIKNNIDEKIDIKTYHVDFLGGKFSYILTKSWIIAQQMGIEEKIIIPIFNGIQQTHQVNDINDIKEIFKEKAGINNQTYQKFWNSFSIKVLIQKNNQEIKKIKLKHVPTTIINGKYIINYSKLEENFKYNFSENYINLIKFLIKKPT
ncbi:thiol:disulfide interchange protein [Buchnera aphidicola (Muscaphis stroyani)]|uniref:Thiol:disulfide interchange protein n=1 Tax=Buchnera aphidicola (Muscaphis stroyani) TaxID=1241869 RepID=A0A4D6Y517_9GAMM|nr:DsbA family protein [Buchnera aphidicola]QCI24477.1 thiol:disulfide interchange protein [Buchnera aphidicola (Muscaphis stroyani)]